MQFLEILLSELLMTLTQNKLNIPHATSINPNMKHWVDNCKISSLGRAILIKSITNPDGRQFVAKSLIFPFVNNFEFLKNELNIGARTQESVVFSLEQIIVEIENYLSILPIEERFSNTVNELRKLLFNIFDFRSQIVKSYIDNE